MIPQHHCFSSWSCLMCALLIKLFVSHLRRLKKQARTQCQCSKPRAGRNFWSLSSYLKVQNNTLAPQINQNIFVSLNYFLLSVHFAGGQDLLAQHSNPNGSEMNGSIRLASPLDCQPASATLTITNDHLLPQSPANSGMAGQD